MTRFNIDGIEIDDLDQHCAFGTGHITTYCPTHCLRHSEDVECLKCVEEDEFYEDLERSIK